MAVVPNVLKPDRKNDRLLCRQDFEFQRDCLKQFLDMTLNKTNICWNLEKWQFEISKAIEKETKTRLNYI